jgi:hypothetical protein
VRSRRRICCGGRCGAGGCTPRADGYVVDGGGCKSGGEACSNLCSAAGRCVVEVF